MLLYLCIFLESYLLGSIPFGLLISKGVYKRDLRKYGSGNIGTTNAMRVLGHAGGTLTFFLATVKGYLAGIVALVLIAAFSGDTIGSFVWASITPAFAPVENAFSVGIAFLGVTLGHVFNPWLKLSGGKGVACAAGCLFVWFGWLPGLIEVVAFACVILIFKFVSAGSLAAAALCPILAIILFTDNPAAIACSVIAAATVIWAHRENIERLITGTERKVGNKDDKAE